MGFNTLVLNTQLILFLGLTNFFLFLAKPLKFEIILEL